MVHCADLLLGSNGGMMGSGSQHFATVRDIGLLGGKTNNIYNVTQSQISELVGTGQKHSYNQGYVINAHIMQGTKLKHSDDRGVWIIKVWIIKFGLYYTSSQSDVDRCLVSDIHA